MHHLRTRGIVLSQATGPASRPVSRRMESTARARKRPAPVTAGEGSISSHEGPSGCGKEKDTGVTARKQAIETLRTLRQARSRDTPRARRGYANNQRAAPGITNSSVPV